MIIVAVLLLTFFISVKSANTTHDAGTFHEITPKNGVAINQTELKIQLTRQRRSVIGTDDNGNCYKQFFIGGLPPTGFHRGPNVRYICQKYGKTRCFSTMFDLYYGIPIYAGYLLQKNQVSSIGTASRAGLTFGLEPGISLSKNEIDEMYSNAGTLPCIHKGHLVPAQAYSFSDGHIRSTFTYTNAVPQYATFNTGQWSSHEHKILVYAKKCGEKELAGDLYLLTGTSDRQIIFPSKTTIQGVHISLIRMPQVPNIVIPNSMWTAGCCVRSAGQHVLGSFAVIGNNDPRKENIRMSQVTVKTLTILLGVTDLFPGKPGCSEDKNDVTI